MKIILERHAYAPELNKAYIGPTHTMIPAPGCTSIAHVRERLFSPLKYRGRFVTLQSINTPERASYNRTRQGFCNDLQSLAGAIRVFRGYHNLPDCKHIVKTELIG